MEQGRKPAEGTSQEELNRQNMSPANYLDWRTHGVGRTEKDTIFKRKLDVFSRIVTVVKGPPVWTNEKVDVILTGEVPVETIQEWIEEARAAKLVSEAVKSKKKPATPHERVAAGRTSQTARTHFSPRENMGYTAGHIADALEKQERMRGDEETGE